MNDLPVEELQRRLNQRLSLLLAPSSSKTPQLKAETLREAQKIHEGKTIDRTTSGMGKEVRLSTRAKRTSLAMLQQSIQSNTTQETEECTDNTEENERHCSKDSVGCSVRGSSKGSVQLERLSFTSGSIQRVSYVTQEQTSCNGVSAQKESPPETKADIGEWRHIHWESSSEIPRAKVPQTLRDQGRDWNEQGTASHRAPIANGNILQQCPTDLGV